MAGVPIGGSVLRFDAVEEGGGRLSDPAGSGCRYREAYFSVPHRLLDAVEARLVPGRRNVFACSGFPSGAAGIRECRLVETTRSPVRCPPVRLHAWAVVARCVAARLPGRFRDGSCCCLADISTGSATLRRSPFAARGALRRSPEDAPLRPAGALGNRTSPADGRITDPRGSVIVGDRCDQPRPGAPVVRAGRLAPGRGASSAGGTRHGPGGTARDPRRVGRASPGPARHERGLARSSQGPCASSVTPNPGTPMPAYGRWYARTGIIWSSSGRTRPVPVTPSVGPARCVTGWSSLANY